MSVEAESLSARKHESGNPAAARLPNRIEITTLVQPLGHDAGANLKHDLVLADLLNLDWEILDISVTSHQLYVATFLHTRVVTLKRIVEAPETPTQQVAEVAAVVEAVKDETTEVSAVASAPDSWKRAETEVNINIIELPVGSIISAAERPPLDDVAYGWASMSGLYSPDELCEIGLREALHAGITASWARQEYNGASWASLLFKLPVSPS